jgi:hypothetical protein
MNRFGFISGDFVYAVGRLYPGGCSYYRCMLPMNAAGIGAKFGPPAWTADRGFGVRLNKDYAQFGFDTIVIKQLIGAVDAVSDACSERAGAAFDCGRG